MGIKFIGTAGDFIAIAPDGAHARVLKTGNKWGATFQGSANRNPLVQEPDGSTWRSAMCPTVEVDGVFRSRREAAEAALEAYRKER